MSTLDTVRRIVGRRHKITRDEMIEILLALDVPPEAQTIAGRDQAGRLHTGDEWVADEGDEQSAMARAWALRCRGITCISVMQGGYFRQHEDGRLDEVESLMIRYDAPGSMHPHQHAELMFVPAALGEGEYDSIGYMRRHAGRVLVVTG